MIGVFGVRKWPNQHRMWCTADVSCELVEVQILCALRRRLQNLARMAEEQRAAAERQASCTENFDPDKRHTRSS